MIPLGQIAYEAYCAHTGGRSLISGAKLPPWAALTPAIQGAWNAAATAVAERLINAESKQEPVPHGTAQD